jgi:hypothetical protein
MIGERVHDRGGPPSAVEYDDSEAPGRVGGVGAVGTAGLCAGRDVEGGTSSLNAG